MPEKKTRVKIKTKSTPSKKGTGYISIRQAAKFCDYSTAALNGDAKRKKLKSVKKGEVLMTTRQWLDQYLEQSKKWDDLTAVPKEKISDDLADEIARELI